MNSQSVHECVVWECFVEDMSLEDEGAWPYLGCINYISCKQDGEINCDF